MNRATIFEVIDGGAVLITGNSNVIFHNCKFVNNKSLLCGGAISNQSESLIDFVDCIFENNNAGHSGSAIDNLTRGSSVKIDRCKFINNQSNSWYKNAGPHGQISLFPKTTASITHSSFEGTTIPIDYYKTTGIDFFNNKYHANWHPTVRTPKERDWSIREYGKLTRRLYWIIPKTIRLVKYRINKNEEVKKPLHKRT